MKYLIVIKKVDVKTKKVSEWHQLWEDEPFMNLQKKNPTEDLKQFGYIESEQEVQDITEIYSQEIEKLDLVKVINAVNS